MFLSRGARVNATNMGDDIPLHLAAAHGHLEVVQLVSIGFVLALINRNYIICIYSCSSFVIDPMSMH